MLEFEHSVDAEPTRLRDVAVWVIGFIAFLCAALWACGCDRSAHRTQTMQNPTVDVAQQTRDDLERCHQALPLERLKCFTHRN